MLSQSYNDMGIIDMRKRYYYAALVLLFLPSVSNGNIELNKDYVVIHKDHNKYSVLSQDLGREIVDFETLSYSIADTNVIVYEQHTLNTGIIVKLTLSPKIVQDTIFEADIDWIKWEQYILGGLYYSNKFSILAIPIELDFSKRVYKVSIMKWDSLSLNWQELKVLNNVDDIRSSGDGREFYFMGPSKNNKDYIRPFIVYDIKSDSFYTLGNMPNMIYRVYRKSIDGPLFLADFGETTCKVYRYENNGDLTAVDSVSFPESIIGIYEENNTLMMLIENRKSNEEYRRKSVRLSP